MKFEHCTSRLDPNLYVDLIKFTDNLNLNIASITCTIDADTEQISDNIHFHRTMHFHHPNSSSHTLQTMRGDDDERASLLSSNSNSSNSYGAAPPSNAPNTRRIVFNATLKMAAIFVCGSLFLGGTLWLSLPPLEPCAHPLWSFPLTDMLL